MDIAEPAGADGQRQVCTVLYVDDKPSLVLVAVAEVDVAGAGEKDRVDGVAGGDAVQRTEQERVDRSFHRLSIGGPSAGPAGRRGPAGGKTAPFATSPSGAPPTD